MLVLETSTDEVAIAPDPSEQHLRRVLSSQHFARAETQRRLLEYLWKHRAEALSEYALATDALGRKTDFDSAVDASVRVHISRLRRKLKDYYQETGEPEQFTIPTGTHQLMVESPPPAPAEVPPSSLVELPTAIPAPERHRFDRARLAIGGVALLATGLVGWLIGHRAPLQTAARPSAFWSDFLGRNNAPIKIVLPTPTFFQFANDKDIRIRSTRVNDFQDASRDPAFRALTDRLGQPILEQHYTVTSDTLAAISMARYLDSFGGMQRVSFDVMRDSDMLVFEQANVIAVGTYQTLHPFHEYLEAMNFSLNHDEQAAMNAHPLAGEQATYPVIQQAPEHIIRPSIIALLPGRSLGLQVLVIESRDTAAIVKLLGSNAGANSITNMLRGHGNPAYWEMVVETELNSEKALRTWPIAIHPYTKGAPASSM